MKLLNKLKQSVVNFSVASSTVITNSAFAASSGGFDKATGLFDNLAATLTGALAVSVITVAVCWVGYKCLWDGKSLMDCKNIIIGGILIGGASGFASYMLS